MEFENLTSETARFYRGVMLSLTNGGVRFMVGGSYALAYYTDIERVTKDLDLFVARSELDDALSTLEADGFTTEKTHRHWLAKVLHTDDSVDLIFASGNALTFVDETWYSHARRTEVLGTEALLCPREEMLAMKAFIMERERYDGADVLHMLRTSSGAIDWERLLNLFGPHWRVLYSHLMLFGYVYPSRRNAIPKWVTDELRRRLDHEEGQDPPREDLCRGTLLSRAQYLVDVERHGFKDARKWPEGTMTSDEIDDWTRSIGDDQKEDSG